MSEATIKTGGPAFPFAPHPQQKLDDGRWDQNYDPGDSGMSLRDYFAGQALLAYGLDSYIDRDSPFPFKWDGLARDCYRIADAMLAAREKSE